MSTIHRYRVPCSGVKAFIEDTQGRLLILRHGAHEFTKRPSWGLPGGHVDWGEEPESSLKREVSEELGVEIEVQHPVLAWNKPISKDHQTIYIGYRCRITGRSKQFRLGPDDDQYHWMDRSELYEYFPKHDREYRPAIMRYFTLT